MLANLEEYILELSIENKSELILNEDGSIYHLKLRNGELAQKVITVGDPERVQEVVKHFDAIYLRRANREFVTVTGRIGSTEISVVSTGIGTDNIDVVFNELQLVHAIDLGSRRSFDPSPRPLQIVRLGTSGTLQSDVPVNSLLISKAALSFDGLLHFYENNFARPDFGLKDIPKPFLTFADKELFQRFLPVADFEGCTVTAAGFYAPQGRNLLAPPKHLNFLQRVSQVSVEGIRVANLEMETAGIYGLGTLLGMKTLSISAILANRITGEFSTCAHQTIEKLITSALDKFVD